MSSADTVFAIKHKNENIRIASRSGGFFTALSDIILDNGGVVYGCALNETFTAVHKRATNKVQRNEFRGSKYVQSKIDNTYNLVAIDLINGLDVLFSGTPCQVHGLINLLKLKKIDTSNLLTIDILCHGVPSPKIWSDYLSSNFDLKYIEKINFRDKETFGWREHVETITVNGKKISSKNYTDSFYSHLILRKSCFNCHYKNKDRISDITIGDYWGIEKNDRDFDDNKGVSLVITNTDKGKLFFQKCSEQLIFKEFTLATSIQPALDHNYPEPANRSKFWQEYNGKNLVDLTKKFSKPPEPPFYKKFLIKCIEHLLKILKKLKRTEI